MAHFKNKQIKINLLCERAQKEDILREELLDQGLPNHEIDKIIQNKRTEKYRVNNHVNPWDETTKTVKLLSTTNIGLSDTHLVKTEAQEMQALVQQKFDKHKQQKFGSSAAQAAEPALGSHKERKKNV